MEELPAQRAHGDPLARVREQMPDLPSRQGVERDLVSRCRVRPALSAALP